MYRNNAYYAPNIEIIEVKVENGYENSTPILPGDDI